MADGIVALAQLDDLQNQINMLIEDIEKLDDTLKDPVFIEYNQAVHKSQLFDEQLKYLRLVNDSINDINLSKIPSLPSDISNDPALKRNQDMLEQTEQYLLFQIQEINKNISSRRLEVEKEKNLWDLDFSQIQKGYEEFVKAKEGDYKAIVTKRTKRMHRLDELKRQYNSANQKSESTKKISDQRNVLLDWLEDIYKEYTDERQKRCDRFQEDSHGRLQLNIRGFSNKDEFKKRLLELKQGSYLWTTELGFK